MVTKKTVKKKVATKKSVSKVAVTPTGMLSFPVLDKPNPKDKYDADKYKTDLRITKDDMRNTPEGKALMKAILEVGRAQFEDDSLTLKDFTHPLKDGDETDYEGNQGCFVIRAKSKTKPVIVGPKKVPLNSEEIAQLQSGDVAKLVVSVFGYDQGEGGVALGLSAVQFHKKGSVNSAAALELLDELEVELEEDCDEEDLEELVADTETFDEEDDSFMI